MIRTAAQLAFAEPPAALPAPDVEAMRAYRYARVQEQLSAADVAAILLINPINIRYATDARNMTVWCLHSPGRYCLVPAEGEAILWDFPSYNCRDTAKGLRAIGEQRRALIHTFFDSGRQAPQAARVWAAEIADAVGKRAGSGARLAVDRTDLNGFEALSETGLTLVEGQRLMELARAIKSEDEILAMRQSLHVCDLGMDAMRAALRPGITENQLWAHLHHMNIAHGGEWIETRLLSSGPRTNPWFQESSDRVIEAGDLVSFDTDMVGPYGYCADVSRTFHCGPGAPTETQRELYGLAAEQVAHNVDLVRPGLAFREYTERAWRIPDRFHAQNYGAVAHGIGMVDEWPLILIDPDDPWLDDDELQPGMTICVESYIGEVGGREGVKLEQQVLVTETGHEVLSAYPLEDALL